VVGYFLKRMTAALPLLLGVNILTFALFFGINSPDDLAQIHLGSRSVTLDVLEDWKRAHGYDLPLFFNKSETGISFLTKTLFFQKSLKLFVFDFGLADNGRDMGAAIQERAGPSLALALPAFFLSMALNFLVAWVLVLFQNSLIEKLGNILCLFLMSISPLFFIIFGQYLAAGYFKWVPYSGYLDGFLGIKFLIVPVLMVIISNIGSGGRWYRGLFLEEVNKTYALYARAKGASPWTVLRRHITPNVLLPIFTSVVVLIPFLFMGNLLVESFFGIPGLGSYLLDALQDQDFAIVRVMVFLGSLLYIVGILLSDLAYVWADPRLRLR